MNHLLRFLPSVCAVFCAMASLLAVQVAMAQTTPAPSNKTVQSERKEFGLKIKNNKKLVTVEDKDGAFLFAQVISTPNLKVVFTKPAKSGFVTVTLRDATNKTLWRTRLGDGGPGTFNFSFAEKDRVRSGMTMSVSPREATEDEAYSSGEGKGIFVLGDDNVLSHADFKSNDGGGNIERVGNKIVMTTHEDGEPDNKTVMSIDLDTKTIRGIQNGEESVNIKLGNESASVKDTTGTFTVRTLKKDGKDYIDLDLGDRHIFIQGGNFKATSDGKDITLTPVMPASP